MEKVTDAGNDPEVYENDIEMYIKLYCEECNIDNLKSESQIVWNGALRYVAKKMFRYRENLKFPGDPQRRYNVIIIDHLCNIYIDLCNKYDKIPGIMGFSYLTEIDSETINNWGYNNSVYSNDTDNYIYNGVSIKLSNVRIGIYKKLSRGRAEGLESRLVTGKQNPVGLLGALNHYENWNMPGLRENTPKIDKTSANELENKYNIAGSLPEKSDENNAN